jgi:hypothetical protein
MGENFLRKKKSRDLFEKKNSAKFLLLEWRNQVGRDGAMNELGRVGVEAWVGESCETGKK